MHFSTSKTLALALGLALAPASAQESICDKYTTALLKDNTPANQYLLLTLLVNTAVIGNYTQPNVGVAVPGILAPGVYNGEQINLRLKRDGFADKRVDFSVTENKKVYTFSMER